MNPGYAGERLGLEYCHKKIIFIAAGVSTTNPLYALKTHFREEGTTRKSQNSIPYRRDDGTRPSNHHPCQARLLRLPREHHPRSEVLHTLQALRGAVDEASSLRFRIA